MDSANAVGRTGSEPCSTPGVPDGSALSERDRAVLDFERQWWKYAGAKEQAVREKFGMSSTRYYQVLNALIDRPEALAHDPLLVRRLRRLRATRQRARSARRLGFEVGGEALGAVDAAGGHAAGIDTADGPWRGRVRDVLAGRPHVRGRGDHGRTRVLHHRRR
jgi:hypothetical protein